jgi:arylsulfatase A
MRRLLALISLAVIASPCNGAADDRPSFLVILCDDLGYGDLGCYGHPTIRTPNLDRLAAEGVRLTDCYSASPLCSPSRCGLLTGRTPSRCGIYSWIAAGNPMQLRPEETTIAELLQAAGYDTLQAGKWHLNGHFNDPRHTQPGDQGFDHWFATQNNAGPSHENPQNFVRDGVRVGKIEGYSCQIVADEAINWLKGRIGDADPFFAYVCFHEPHEQVASPTALVETYPEATERGQALYYANVTNMDAAVGRLVAALDELQLSDNTFVFFSSDNGPETLNRYPNGWRSHGSPGPLRGMKLHIYDGGIRVPGIVRFPGRIAAGSECSEPVCSLDILPTFCVLAGVPLPTDKPLDGVSVAPLFGGRPVVRGQPLFWHYYGAPNNRQVAIRDGDWKLVAGWDGADNLPTGGSLEPGVVDALKHSELVDFELYNVREDIGETRDLSAQEPQRLEQLTESARRLYREVIEEGPDWEFPQP